MKITVSTFFNEFTAIPEDIRTAYLFNLKNRKGSQERVKIKVLEIIYRCINRGKTDIWSDKEICSRLNIKPSALYCYKSRLLKGLRLFYYGVNGADKKVIKASYRITKSTGVEALHEVYKNAKLLYNAGLRREAKNVLLKLAPRFEKIYRSGSGKYILLSELYEYIIDFYFNQRNLKGFNIYKKKLDSLLKKIAAKRHSREYSLLHMRREHASALKSYFHHLDDKSFIDSHKKCVVALKYAKRVKDRDYILLFYFRCGMTALNTFNVNKAIEYFKQGRNYAGAGTFECYAFESFLIVEEFNDDKQKGIEFLTRIRKCYDEVKHSAQHSFWFIQTLYNYGRVLGYFNFEKEALRVQEELIRFEILYPRASLAWWQLYFSKRNMKIFNYSLAGKEEGKKLLYVTGTCADNINSLESYIHKAFAYFKNFRFMSLKGRIYIDWLWSELLRGREMNFDKAKNIINLVDRIIHTRNIGMSTVRYEVIKLGVFMIRDSIYLSKKEMLNKYLFDFSQKAGRLIKEEAGNLLDDYSIMCLIANNVNCKEVWKIVTGLYNWIEINHPEILEPVLNEIRASQKVSEIA